MCFKTGDKVILKKGIQKETAGKFFSREELEESLCRYSNYYERVLSTLAKHKVLTISACSSTKFLCVEDAGTDILPVDCFELKKKEFTMREYDGTPKNAIIALYDEEIPF